MPNYHNTIMTPRSAVSYTGFVFTLSHFRISAEERWVIMKTLVFSVDLSKLCDSAMRENKFGFVWNISFSLIIDGRAMSG